MCKCTCVHHPVCVYVHTYIFILELKKEVWNLKKGVRIAIKSKETSS